MQSIFEYLNAPVLSTRTNSHSLIGTFDYDNRVNIYLNAYNYQGEPLNWISSTEEKAYLVSGHIRSILEDIREEGINIEILQGNKEKWLIKTNSFYRTGDIIKKYTSPSIITLYKLQFNIKDPFYGIYLMRFFKVFYNIRDSFQYYVDETGSIYLDLSHASYRLEEQSLNSYPMIRVLMLLLSSIKREKQLNISLIELLYIINSGISINSYFESENSHKTDILLNNIFSPKQFWYPGYNTIHTQAISGSLLSQIEYMDIDNLTFIQDINSLHIKQ